MKIKYFMFQRSDKYRESKTSRTLSMRDYKDASDLVLFVGGGTDSDDMCCEKRTKMAKDGMTVFENHQQDTRFREMGDICQTLSQQLGTGGNNQPFVVGEEMEKKKLAVRRLTPLESERLQGLPDGWTDLGDWTDSQGKVHKAADAPRFRAIGNGIATPYWKWICKRISAEYERPATLGSLFDGIGSFPYCWVLANGPGTVLWGSEIEEFPMAVSKKHFGDEDAGIEGDIWQVLAEEERKVHEKRRNQK